MFMRNRSVLLAACFLGLAPPAAAQTPTDPGAIEIRFCPEAVARPYPLDSLRGIQGLLIQNIALVNRGTALAALDSVEIALMRDGEILDSRRLGGADLAASARAGQSIESQGLMQLLGFQFCDGRLLGDARLSAGPGLEAGQAMLVMQQVFAWRGRRDAARITVRASTGGRPVEASRTLRLDGAVSRTTFRWPLRRGPWLAAAGASFHTTHRWGVPEEFALDIFAIGADGRTYEGNGARNEDFHAYGAEVVAAADGRVARVVSGSTEAAPMLRAAGETIAAYYGRIAERQFANLAAGEAATLGDTVIIDHGNGEFSSYAHLVPGSIDVAAGAEVRAGARIGRLGSSGNSTEPHLHFQVCDRAGALSCAGLIPNFAGIELPLSDGPRPLQSGDIVIAPD